MNKFKVETYKDYEDLLVLKVNDITLVSRCGVYWSIIDDFTMDGYEVGARYIMLIDNHPWVHKGCIFEVENVDTDGCCFTKCNNIVGAGRLTGGEVIKLEFHPMKFRVMNVSHYYKLMGELTAHGYRFERGGGGFINDVSDDTVYLFTDTEGFIEWSTDDYIFEEDEREECKLVNGTNHLHLHRTTNIVVK